MKKVLVFILILASNMLYAQETIKLYDVVPNSKTSDITEKSETAADGITRVSQVVSPEIIMYRPEKPNGTAVLICPGGGYRILAITHEGHDVAKVFNQWGVTAFVLKYRLPDDKIMMDKTIGPLQDAERCIQLIRQNAKQWGIDPRMVGVMGFSAGGHLAASLSTKYTLEVIENHKHISLRPDFSVLVYPVISFTDSLGHTGSRDNLIGKNPSPDKIKKFSNELLVNKKTPPAFLVHAKDDGAVPFGNSMVYYEALQKNKIPAAVRLFEKGGHGFGMHNKKEAGDWMSELQQWLVKEKFLK
ncbi:alpha/beta hydrolase [Niabella sp. 22666]|uniref:alpha/beta hydrolase n=1 Tax=Niabella sp. 22666 TaxID=3453954 RepID=UPI003F863E17